MTDLTNLSSKVVRAFWFYLIDEGVVDESRCYHTFDARPRAFNDQPIVNVEMRPLGPTVVFTGDDDFVVEIQVKQQFAQQPNMANSESQRIAFDRLVGQVRQRLALSNDGGNTFCIARDRINQAAWSMAVPVDGTDEAQQFAENHEDMADFSIQKLLPDVNGVATAADVNMAVVQRFRVTACETNVFSGEIPQAIPMIVVSGLLQTTVGNSDIIATGRDSVTGQPVVVRIKDWLPSVDSQ